MGLFKETKRWWGVINLLLLALFVSDRIFKKLALHGAKQDFSFFKFTFYQNPVMGLSIPARGFWFYLILVAIMLWVIVSLVTAYKQAEIKSIIGFTLILLGASSNLLDRWQIGGVIDYFNLSKISAFNLADMMILAGVIILIFEVFSGKSDERLKPPPPLRPQQ